MFAVAGTFAGVSVSAWSKTSLGVSMFLINLVACPTKTENTNQQKCHALRWRPDLDTIPFYLLIDSCGGLKFSTIRCIIAVCKFSGYTLRSLTGIGSKPIIFDSKLNVKPGNARNKKTAYTFIKQSINKQSTIAIAFSNLRLTNGPFQFKETFSLIFSVPQNASLLSENTHNLTFDWHFSPLFPK